MSAKCPNLDMLKASERLRDVPTADIDAKALHFGDVGFAADCGPEERVLMTS